MEMLIVVDESDREIQHKEKESCHLVPASLHRAFSIFIVNGKGQMLIHKRQATKKTWPGFWTNACCSHPRKNENLYQATLRRMQEELGIYCQIRPLFKFHYQAVYDQHYGEHEIDHVFLGIYDGDVEPNVDEIQEYKFVSIQNLTHDIRIHEGKYTPWFKLALPRVLQYL